MSFLRYALILSTLAFAAAAVAGPRTTVSYSNIDSIAASGNPANVVRTVTLTGGYPIKHIDFSGTLQTIIPNTEAFEAQVVITPPPGMGPVFLVPIVWNTALQPAGTILADTFTLNAPPAGWFSSGTWTFEFVETFDDGAGADSRWKTFNISFNDSAVPPTTNYHDLGLISTGQRIVYADIQPAAVEWYRFHLASPIGALDAGNALAIDTFTSGLNPVTDTVLALYNDRGQRIAFNDDINGGANRLSVLSFGTSIPPGSPVLDTRIGADGALDPGTYYLAVCAYASTNTYNDDFAVTSAATPAGSVQVTFRASVPGAAGSCPADFNHSGNVEVQDIFDYLSAWFGGCN